MYIIGNKRPEGLSVNTVYCYDGPYIRSIYFGWFNKKPSWDKEEYKYQNTTSTTTYIGYRLEDISETFIYSRYGRGESMQNFDLVQKVDPVTGIYQNIPSTVIREKCYFDLPWLTEVSLVKLDDCNWHRVIVDEHKIIAKDSQRFVLETNYDDRAIELSDGSFLFKCFGKYEPNLAILCQDPEIKWDFTRKSKFNLGDGGLECLTGDFFVSKKGTNCFRIKKGGKHILIRDEWGGPDHPRTRGGILPKDNAIYYRRASSHGGGTGYDYGVYAIDWKHQLSIDDI